MELFLKGMTVPALGSIRDVMMRKYLIKQAGIEAKRAEFEYLIAIATPTFSDPNDRRNWNSAVKKTYLEYVHMIHGMKPRLIDEDDIRKIEFYEQRIKSSKMLLYKNDKGELIAEGFLKTGKSQMGASNQGGLRRTVKVPNGRKR